MLIGKVTPSLGSEPRNARARLLERRGLRPSWGALSALLGMMVIATVLQAVLSLVGLAIAFGVWD